ncbi:EscU/YscU/HrcU family type III secretion system export apparatus switch protein [Burkholderia cepacia]|uniref:FlhB HrpN YscU SpaS family protein n=1 Tax=Burkholderia cepacia TaxID=292 RepID=A0AA88Z483_BURCE|nr:EscU/YscU/HrcU family type III secretion system export apparatus switch protein [Burkholderia cepacia]KGB98786.1 flhB HrpN YscU SpaS family protein [Burkholderia cepacia]
MSDTDQNKSEEATAYKLAQARKKGMVPRSQDLGIVVSLLCCSGYLWARGDQMAARFSALNARLLSEAGALTPGGNTLLVAIGRLISDAVHIVAPMVGIVMAGSLTAALMQTGFLFAPGALKADFSKLNPAQGFKRIFSMQTLVEAAKAFVKMAVYTAIAYTVIADTVITSVHAVSSAIALGAALKSTGLHLLFMFLSAAVVFAAVDQILVRRAFAKKMRMSRHEQKQEIKQREGDPRIKQRRKQLQRELLQRASSMRNMRGADVLVTNPTHYAVGLKYDPASMAAPEVVAKGAGDFAQRLKKLAFIYGVPVVESRAFARRLFHKAALEREVPSHLYSETAAVYLKARRAPSRTRAA